MASTLEIKFFRDIPLADPFFSSLKEDYQEFADWFQRKSSETAYVQYTDSQLTGFMYLKLEEGPVNDVVPPMPAGKRIKIGTLKVEAHGTKLGERMIKKAMDNAVVQQADELYVTIFPKHQSLITLLEEFGFGAAGQKKTDNGTEGVLAKSLDRGKITGNMRQDYPLMDTRKAKFYLLAIRPEWHSKLFPDSLLKTESYNLLEDVSHTNSISKTYICSMSGVDALHTGDLLVIYRMKDDQGPAEYRSVATSICVVEEMRPRSAFASFSQYVSFTEPYSVFNQTDLLKWWKARNNLFVIKMLYNGAFTHRVIRQTLADEVGLDRKAYWGFMPLTREQFLNIASRGGIDERLIVR